MVSGVLDVVSKREREMNSKKCNEENTGDFTMILFLFLLVFRMDFLGPFYMLCNK